MTIIVSALYTTGWVGIGFSKDGRMVGSSAMIGWISKKGQARIKQYYLQGTERDQVVPDQGELQLQKVPPVVALHGAMIYLAFQVKFAVKVPRRAVILAFSTTYPSKLGRLTKHDDKTTVIVDFSKGINLKMTFLFMLFIGMLSNTKIAKCKFRTEKIMIIDHGCFKRQKKEVCVWIYTLELKC